MFTRNDCLHQENILFFDFKSSGGTKSKCFHCVPAENEQMASFSCAMSNFFLHIYFNSKPPSPYPPEKRNSVWEKEKEKTVKHEWQWKSMKS